jgi:hypothetical protein
MTQVRDTRDDTTWVVIELTESGEGLAEEGSLDGHLRNVLDCGPDHPIFVPYTCITRHNRRVVINVIEGYAFIATGLQDHEYLSLVYKSNHVKSVMHRSSSGKIPVLTPVPDKSVKDLQHKLREMISKEVVIGTEVCVQEGMYKGLIGHVVETYDNEAIVFVSMRTIKALKSFPKYILRLCDNVLGFDSPSEVYPNYEEEVEEDE